MMFGLGKKKIVVRMAPSPTGNLHIGTARATLFNYLYAKKNGGKFILRIEDTDKERSTKAFEENIVEGLSWLGLKYDEFYRQSERTEIYLKYLKQMIADGSAYISHEEPKEEGQRSEVIRFKNPKKKIVFEDLIRGSVEFDTTELGDFIVAKSETEPLYHLAVVVDDHEMGVTHVIRGEDHISNTPRQILIQEAIGAVRPIYAHMPLILDSARAKLSKRKHGEMVWVDTYKNKGYLPEAMLNYMALLGWNPGGEQEIFSIDELTDEFEISKMQKGGAVFDEKKLRWVNKEHIKRLPKEVLADIILAKIGNSYPGREVKEGLVAVVAERIEILSDIDSLIGAGELSYFFETPEIDMEKLVWKNSTREETLKHLEEVRKLIESEKVDEIMTYAEGVGKGNVLWPLRYALSGKEKSPDPFTLLKILGREESLKRVDSVLVHLK
jgi:glutamyl-tRNA synthetase